MNSELIATAAGASSIPFKASADISAMDVLGVVGVAVGLLALALVLALVARRQGWLRRWGVAPEEASSPPRELRVEQVLRLSRHSVIFRIVDGERRLLVVESKDGVQVLSSQAPDSGERSA